MSINTYGHDVTLVTIENTLPTQAATSSSSSSSSSSSRAEAPKAKRRKTSSSSATTRKGKGSEMIFGRNESRVSIQTSMTLKGGEADAVHLFGFEARYNLEHFSKNRQLKLLYVALSRAKDVLCVYLDYNVINPTFLHVALEGSVLVERSIPPRPTSWSGIKEPCNLEMKVECSGFNLDNSGGLSQCNTGGRKAQSGAWSFPTHFRAIRSRSTTSSRKWCSRP